MGDEERTVLRTESWVGRGQQEAEEQGRVVGLGECVSVTQAVAFQRKEVVTKVTQRREKGGPREVSSTGAWLTSGRAKVGRGPRSWQDTHVPVSTALPAPLVELPRDTLWFQFSHLSPVQLSED